MKFRTPSKAPTASKAPIAPIATIALAIVLLIASSAGAQGQDPMAQADAYFKASDWTRASDAYTAIARKDTTNGMAFFRAGVANHALKRYEPAKQYYRRAIALKFQAAAAQIQLARMYVVSANKDSAFIMLDALAKSGFPQTAPLTSQADFDAIRDDARFKSIIAAIDESRFPCRKSAERRELDYWIGEWDVFVGGAKAGTNDVVRILGTCVLQENWTGAGGGEGKSVNYYDPNIRKWKQVWTDDRGGVLDYTGEFKDGAMRFQGVTIDAQGTRTLQKLTFFPIAADSVRQLFETSTDEGKTWVPGFDGMYVRRKK